MGRTAIGGQDVSRMAALTRTFPDDGGDPLPWAMLHELKDLIECDHVSVCGQDTPRHECFASQDLEELDMPDGVLIAYEKLYWSSTCSYPDRTGDLEPVLRESDLMCDRERRASPMYLEFDRYLGFEHELRVCFSAGAPQRTYRLMFNRGPGSDFSQRDVDVLTVLRPHLEAALSRARGCSRPAPPLTDRQRQILQFVAAGSTNGQIAHRLGVSEATVRKHMENAFARMGVHSRAAAVSLLNLPR